MGLKLSRIDGRSAAARGLRFPKKAVGVGTRDVGRALGVEIGLDIALGAPGGLREFAAGLGLNSAALILNFEETAEVGVRTLLGVCEVAIGATLAAGRVEGLEILCIGSGLGTATGIPALWCLWLS